MKVRLLSVCLAAALMLSASVSTLDAQPATDAATAALTVRIVDETGAAIPQASVRVEHVSTRLQRQAETANNGQVTIPLLPSGTYTVMVDHAGFSPARVDDVVLKAGGEASIQVQLKVDALAEAVIVTAQKRGNERLLDVPIPVTVVDTERLALNNQARLRDYYAMIPGFSVVQGNFSGSTQKMTIRGIPPVGGTPTVGIMIDDVPYGSPAYFAAAQQIIPDFDPSDLARLEVLRGPQGTLYGASSMGGLLKYVTTDPSTEKISGRLQLGLGGVHNGAQPGYSLRGSVNVPVTRTLAIRASGFFRQDAGYVDNPVLGIDGLNETHVGGGRVSALWRPSGRVSLKLSGIYQRMSADGLGDVTPGLGDLQQSYPPGVGGVDNEAQAYSAILTTNFGKAQITALSGFNIYAQRDETDASAAQGQQAMYGRPGSGFDGFGVSGVVSIANRRTNKFTQELRLWTPLGRRFEWLVGGFYTREHTDIHAEALAIDPATGITVGTFLYTPYPSRYEEYAAFSDLTYTITHRFDVQVGGRYGAIHQAIQRDFVGPYVPVFLGRPSPLSYPLQRSEETPFTYLVTPRFKVSPALMIYTRFASGFRPGNVNFNPGAGVPPQFNHDTTQSYEVGFKGEVLERKATIDVSLYRTNWKDIQLGFLHPVNTISYVDNGSDAKSQGVELSVETRPRTGLTVSGWFVYNDATLTDDFPINSQLYGKAGARLPFTSRVSGYASLEQQLTLPAHLTGFAGGSVSYVGAREGNFRGSSAGAPLPRQIFPAYAQIDLRAGIGAGVWTMSVYANNVTDKRALVGGGVDAFPVGAQAFIQPRTIGVSMVRTF